MFLLTADRKIDPKIFPGVEELRNHMGNLNEQIMIFHSLTIPAEKMFEKKAAWCKILCKRNSTKPRMALGNRAERGLKPHMH